MAELNVGFVNIIRSFLNKTVFRPTVQSGDESKKLTTAYKDSDVENSSWYRILKDWYNSLIGKGNTRIAQYRKFEFLDDNLAEGSASLNIYADNIVSGAIGGSENYTVLVDKNAPNIELIEQIIRDVEKRTGIKDSIWDIARNMTEYGDDFEEVVIIKGDDGKYSVDALKPLEPHTIYADVDERGIWNDSDFPYMQKVDMYDKEPVRFDWWRLIHFKIGRDVYGVNNSLFANASQRIGRQLLWIDDAMVLARMSRAYMRYAWMIDTKGLSPDEAWEYTERWKSRVARKEVVDRETGRIGIDDSPPLPDEDLFIPTSEGKNNEVRVLSGDLNIGNIVDVQYFQSKFFMATSIPKAYAGIEEGVRSKATLSMIDVQFARQVRRRQNALLPGLKRFYELVFVLAGIDPLSFEWSIQFPELNTIDEVQMWEMNKVKAEVAKIMIMDIGVLNSYWVYKEIFQFTDEDIINYGVTFEDDDTDEFGETRKMTPELLKAMRGSSAVRDAIHSIRDIVKYKADRARQADGKKPVGIEREDSL